jgi:hypothetical protein
MEMGYVGGFHDLYRKCYDLGFLQPETVYPVPSIMLAHLSPLVYFSDQELIPFHVVSVHPSEILNHLLHHNEVALRRINVAQITPPTPPDPYRSYGRQVVQIRMHIQ